VETLVLAADPMVLFADRRATALVASGAVALAALAILGVKRRSARQAEVQSHASAMTWLVMSSVTAVCGQALFFVVMARPLNGLHYAILLAPWYAIPTAALLAAAVLGVRHPAARLAAPALGVVAVSVLLALAPGRADRFAELTAWNYRAIVTALDRLCDGQAVETIEGPGLVDELTPSYDSVLRYVMNRGLSTCRYDGNSDVVIVANRGGSFDESIEVTGRRYAREQVLPPGLARYRRVP
jgi:hypothetical protein